MRVCVWGGGGEVAEGPTSYNGMKSQTASNKNHIRNSAFENYKVPNQITLLRNRSSVGRHRVILMPGPEVIKTFFMLNSTEHEIFSAHKY